MTALHVCGRLRRPAYSRVAPDGRTWLCVEIEHPGGRSGAPILAERLVGTGPAAQRVAAISAGHLRTGAEVSVHALRFELGHKPEPHLHLLEVQHIHYPTPRPHHEPAQKEAA